MKRICIFGDSVVCGEGDTVNGGWVNLLAKHLKDYEIFNLGIDGGTIQDIQEIFEKEIKEKNPDTIIFEAGGNDSAYDIDSNEFLVFENEFRKSVNSLILHAQKHTENIIFIGFTNCDESKTMPVDWCNLCYENKNIQKYNEIISNICDQNGVVFIDTYEILDNDDFFDGLHPNSIGHEKIFQRIKEFIK